MYLVKCFYWWALRPFCTDLTGYDIKETGSVFHSSIPLPLDLFILRFLGLAFHLR